MEGRPGRRGDRLDPAPPELGGLKTERQTALSLIEMRTQHGILACHRLRDLLLTVALFDDIGVMGGDDVGGYENAPPVVLAGRSSSW